MSTAIDYQYPAFAYADRLPGVTLRENPDPDAALKHRLIKPSVTLPVKVAHGKKGFQDEQLLLQMRPYKTLSDGDPDAVITFIGGPRDWWDLEHGIQDPTLKLSQFGQITKVLGDRRQDGFSAVFGEVYGRRRMVFATCAVKLSRFTRERQMVTISLRARVLADGAIVQWTDPARRYAFEKTVLADPADLLAAIKALKAAFEQAEIVETDSYYFE